MPRPPSARLRQQLFPAAAAHGESHSLALPLWGKFAATMGVALLMTILVTQHHEKPGYLAVSGASNVLASLSSNIISFCADDITTQRNNATFDWTRTEHPLSTTGSFPQGKTNLEKL
jgi:hypothetical protein